MLREEAFEIEDIALDKKQEHPYFIQNLLNVMNNRKVDQSSAPGSLERSLEKRRTNDTTVIADLNPSTRPGLAEKIASAKHERLEKSPVMKYLSISLVKENAKNGAKRKESGTTIRFHNHKHKVKR